MKKLLLTIFILLICININIFPKWTVIKFYGYEDEYNEKGFYNRGKNCMLLFDGNEGYVARKWSVDTASQIQFLKTTDRGDTWHYLPATIDSTTWLQREGKWYLNACYLQKTNCHFITDNYFYMLFQDVADDNEWAAYKLNDSTFTRNAVVLRYDRKTDDFELIETDIYGGENANMLKMLNDKTGFYLSRLGLYKTSDSCKTWTKLYDLPYVPTEMTYFSGLSAPTEQDIYMIGWGDNFASKRILFHSHDGGVTWLQKVVYDINRAIFDSTGLGYIVGNNVYCNEDGEVDYRKFYVAKTTDYCETADTLITRNSVDYLGGKFSQNSFCLGSIVALGRDPKYTAVSWNNGKDWEFLDTITNSTVPVTYTYGSIVDSTRLYFDEPNSARWYIYDRETNSVVESPYQQKYDCLLYPNPLLNNEVLNINFHTEKRNQAIKCSINDITGKILDEYSDNMFGTQVQIRYELDERFSIGTYFIVIEADGEIIAREKFIVE